MVDLHKAREFSDLHKVIEDETEKAAEMRRTLRNLDMFVLDNSLRESTVGQLRGHTLENKRTILAEVKKCGFKHIIVSAFSHVPRVDDYFVKELSEQESDDMSCYYAFTEIGEGINKQDMPVGLKKMEEYKIRNPIFEIDLAKCDECGDDNYTQIICNLLKKRIDYTYENLASDAKIFVNLRDFPFAMATLEYTNRVFEIVKFVGSMPKDVRPFGIMFEEPTGRVLPESVGGWTKAIRMLMDRCDWKSGHLLAHIHKKWDFSEVTQLVCLSSGANGVWASVCEEGAALGHACSVISIMNLIRLGNRKVLGNFNCTYLRNAAINVTMATTGSLPHPKQTIYGERALDIAFDFGGIAGGHVAECEFDMAKFFGVEPPKRISTLATAEMVRERLIKLYGDHEQFTMRNAAKMKALITEDLKKNRKEEYMSAVGIALLFDRAGGKLTEDISLAIKKEKVKHEDHKELIKEVRVIWDKWDLREELIGDECLEFYSFYNGFMSPYFGCYECEDSRKGLQAIDMDKDGKVDWHEFCVYLKWALQEYPDISTKEELLSTAFQKGLIPAMQDEIVKSREKKQLSEIKEE